MCRLDYIYKKSETAIADLMFVFEGYSATKIYNALLELSLLYPLVYQ